MELELQNEGNAAFGRKLRIITAIHLAILQQFVGINAVVAYGV